ncbi:hypothetical protein PENTCL1PPCAC_8620 [Pristionchus entomophagus]|uniref:Protein kinase domain-containing protein n=1 Tax=Pristionchus entomophagus TaxID=358040 RepID=A0AAV5T275_9BILA|nr:hypothetical protein PENTCL1PPCAC_8620 [Pristionchus entomophagus]
MNQNMDSRNEHKIRSWFKQIITVLEYIPSKLLIHRDLKPENILIASDDVLKIGDLCIATAFTNGERALTMRTDTGTELYKAPEQAMIYDQRVDIFASGLIFAELSVPMTLEDKIETFTEIRCGKEPSILATQPPTLDLVTKLTKLDRDQHPGFSEILSHPFFTD